MDPSNLSPKMQMVYLLSVLGSIAGGIYMFYKVLVSDKESSSEVIKSKKHVDKKAKKDGKKKHY
jgi:hypothetical protein